MDKFEYFGGLPEVGIVPRAPHAGPLLQHVYEQEHGRGGFAGKVSHTYHLYPPTNWLPAETRVLDGRAWAPDWESPLRPVGGAHHALGVARPPAPRDVYRGMARLVANATVAMNVTAPAAPDGLLLRAPLGHPRVLRPRGRRARSRPLFGPIDYGKRRLPHRAQGHHAPLRAARRGPSTTGCTRASRAIPRRRSRPPPGSFITHSRSDYRFPRTLDTRNESGRFEIVSKVGRHLHAARAPHPSLRRGGLARRLPAVQVRGGGRAAAHRRPLARAAVGPHRLQAARLLPLRLHRALASEKEGMWLPFFHKNLDYCETLGYHCGDFFSAGRRGPGGHGHRAPGRAARTAPSRPRSRRSWTASVPESTTRSASWRTSPTPRRSPSTRWACRSPDYMRSWGGYTTEPRFALPRRTRLAEVRALAERLADARDELRPPMGDEGAAALMRLGLFSVVDHYPAGARAHHRRLLRRSCSSRPRPRTSWGFDSFWVAEHHFHEYGAVPAAAGAAGRRRPADAPDSARLGRGGAALRPPAARGRGLRDGRRALGRAPQPRAWARAISSTSTRASASTRRTSARASTRRSRSCSARGRASASPTRGATTRCSDVQLNVRPRAAAAAARVGGHPPHRRRARIGAPGFPVMLIPYASAETLAQMAEGVAEYRAAFVAAGGPPRGRHRAVRSPPALRGEHRARPGRRRASAWSATCARGSTRCSGRSRPSSSRTWWRSVIPTRSSAWPGSTRRPGSRISSPSPTSAVSPQAGAALDGAPGAARAAALRRAALGRLFSRARRG